MELTSEASRVPQYAPECHEEGVPAPGEVSQVERETRLSLVGLRHSCGQPLEDATARLGQELRGCHEERKWEPLAASEESGARGEAEPLAPGVQE